MSRYLITGRSGSGKSTVGKALRHKGYQVFDGDRVPGLCRWEDVKTGDPVKVNTDEFVDYAKVAWNWDGAVLEKLLSSNDSELFLCGSASNQSIYHGLFDKVFILSLDKKTHKKRIIERENYGNYGKHPKMIKQLLAEQQQQQRETVKSGAIPIDASQSLEKVVDDILAQIRATSKYGARK